MLTKKTLSRVLVIESGSLFDDAVTSLLKQNGEIQVLTTDFKDNTTLFQEISQLSPEAILMNGDGAWEAARFCEMADALPALARLRVIVVHPDDNVIEVYERQRILASQTNDLIAIIKRGDSTLDGIEQITAQTGS
jgi:DNA-binding NarL/FixJ family response regulator